MRRTILTVILVMVTAGLLDAQPRERTPAEKMEATCTGYCHGPNLIAQQRLDRNGWTRELDKMIRWGAEVPANEREALLDFLVRSFGVNRPRPNTNLALPTGKGSDIALVSCMSCHDDRPLQRLRGADRAAWEREVDKMIKLGAYVPTARKAELVDYFVSAWK